MARTRLPMDVPYEELVARYEDDSVADRLQSLRVSRDEASEREDEAEQAGTVEDRSPDRSQSKLASSHGAEDMEGEWDSDDSGIAQALDWADLRDDLQMRGGTTKAGSSLGGPGPNSQGAAALQSQPRKGMQSKAKFQRLEAHFHEDMGSAYCAAEDTEEWDPLEEAGPANMHTSVVAAARRSAAAAATGISRRKDKADRATVQTVLDPRTRMMLCKMMNAEVFCDIHGCVATGKEANVYLASSATGDLALKIYKTSILVFKDRQRYVTGDPRFRGGYARSNPRKMVAMWAEKELRNLARLVAAGLRAPAPRALRGHVLAMDFLGADSIAAPRLKNARLSGEELSELYVELVLVLRRLYQDCRLIHADLSEYNILVHEGHLWLIDVSQAVDLDHPRALEFLREDCAHATSFFRRASVPTVSTRELFEFVTDPAIHAGNVDAALSVLRALAASRPIGADPDSGPAAQVWQQAYIPRRLEEVEDHEADYARLRAAAPGAEAEGIYYQRLAGMRDDMSGAAEGPAIVDRAEQATGGPAGSPRAPQPNMTCKAASEMPLHSEGTTSSSGRGSSDEDGEDEGGRRPCGEEAAVGPEAAKALRKAHKAAVKEANKERRKHKLPKHVKKKAVSRHQRK